MDAEFLQDRTEHASNVTYSCVVQAEAEHAAEHSSEDGSDADERYFGSTAGTQQGPGRDPNPRAELETDLAVEALLAAAAEMGASGPSEPGNHDATLLQVLRFASVHLCGNDFTSHRVRCSCSANSAAAH